MKVRFVYASGEAASKLARLLLSNNPRIVIQEQYIGSKAHLVFTIPEMSEQTGLVQVNELNAVRLASIF